MRGIPLLFVVAALAAGESYPSWWSYVSPEASALVGIRWEYLRQSPFADALSAELLGSGGLGLPDLPCLKEAKQIVISSPALLAMASGFFPVETLRQQASRRGLKPANYHGVDLWFSSDKATLSVAQISEQLLLIAARSTLETAIDRNLSETDPAGSGRRYSPLLARAARFAQDRDLWVVANGLRDPLASRFVPLDFETQSFQGGISMRNGFQLYATLEAGSEQIAAEIVEELRQSIPGLPAIAQNLQVRVAADAVFLDLDLSRDQFEASLQPRSVSSKPQPATSPEPHLPAVPKVIRIFGLDQNPREIILPSTALPGEQP